MTYIGDDKNPDLENASVDRTDIAAMTGPE